MFLVSSWSCLRSIHWSQVLTGQGATPVRGAPGWLALNPVAGMREPPSGSMQLQKLQFQSVIYRNPEHSNWHQSFPTHIWLFLAQCGMLAGFIKTMQAEKMQNHKRYINILWGKTEKWGEKTTTFQRITYRLYIWKVVRKSNVRQVRTMTI